MAFSLKEYVEGSGSNAQSKPVNSGFSLKDYVEGGGTQQNVVTPRVTSVPQNNPTVVSTPANNKVTIGEGLGNLGSAIGEGVGNFAQEVASNPLEYAKNTFNSLIVDPVKELAANVFNTDPTKNSLAAIGGGIAKGAIELPQNIWNLGVDAVNAYNATPEQNQYKAHYVEDIANALQDNSLYQNLYQKPKQANPTIAELSSFAAPMAAAGKIAKTANAIKTAGNISRESTRIASKLNDAQKLKYAKQIQKLAEKNIANNTVPPSQLSQLINNVGTGAALGALEGETLQDRMSNAAGMAGLGALLHGGQGTIKAAGHTKFGQGVKSAVKEGMNNLTETSPLASQIIAGLDTSFNTNMSDNASDMTKLRKEAYKKLSESQNYKRYASEEELSDLEKAGQLSEEAEKQLFEVNKRGMREAALRMAKEQKDAKRAQKEEEVAGKNRTITKSQEEADQWFEDRNNFVKKLKESQEAWEKQEREWEEKKKQENASISKDDLTEVKSETDMNIPKDTKTPQNGKRIIAEKEKTENVEPKNQEENIVKFDEEGLEQLGKEMQDWLHPSKKNSGKLTKLESGKAEGSDSSHLYEKKLKGRFGTNKLDKDNNLIGDYEETNTSGIHEYKPIDLEPSDTASLRKEIDEWNKKDFESRSKQQEEHLPNIEDNKKQIDGITKKYLGFDGIYNYSADPSLTFSGKMVKKQIRLSGGETIERMSYEPRYKGMAHKLRVNNNLPNIKKCINELVDLNPSVEVRDTLERIYRQAPSSIKKYIDSCIKEKGLNYTLDGTLETKTVNQIRKENKQVRTFMEDESMKGISDVQGFTPTMRSAQKTEVRPNAKIRPYEGDAPAGNTMRDAKTWRKVENITPKKDVSVKNNDKNLQITYNGIGEKGKEIREKGGLVSYKQIIEHFDNSKLGSFTKALFDRHRDIGVNEVKKEMLSEPAAYRHASDELFIQEGLSDIEKAAKIAHELGHREIYQADKEGGKRAVNMAYAIFNEILPTDKAVEKLREAVNNNVIANDVFKKEYDKLCKKYGKEFVDNAVDECVELINSGKTTRSLIKDKRDVWNRYKKVVPDTEIESYCNRLENEVRNEQRELGRRNDSVHTETSRNITSNKEGKRTGSSELSESEIQKTNGKNQGNIQEEGLEYSTRLNRMLDWFDNTKDKSADLYKKIKEDILPEVKDVSKVFKTLNDEREQFFREFGTYTDERMKNRLFKQSESGEGIYFQQMTKDDGKVHFGKESNDKVGFTGKKELEGISQKGTAQQSLLRGFEDRVKRVHTRNIINFYKENFSEQREGTIPVNSKLLANTMYFGKSKAFYETIRKGKDAIDATFDEKNAKEWKE